MLRKITIHFLLVFIVINEVSAQTCKSEDKFSADSQGNVQFKDLDGNLKASTMKTEYDAKGLQPFFNLANSFMNTVQPKSLSKELSGIDLNNLGDNETKEKIIAYETPIIVAVAFGLLFMIVMPIVGFCFCCCRCCGNCGGKKFQDPKEAGRHAKCFFMSVILIIIAIFMLCGVLFMFVTNNRTHDTISGLGNKYENVIDNAVSIATSTVKTVEVISNDFLPCLVELVKEQIARPNIILLIGNPLKDFVSNRIDGTLKNGTNMATNVDDIKLKLDGIKSLSEKLKSSGTDLESSVANIKGKLDNVNCGGVSACVNKITTFKNQISVTIDFNALPDIQSSIVKIKEIQDKNISGLIGNAKKIITDIPDTTWSKSETATLEINRALDTLRTTISAQVSNITVNINQQVDQRKPELMQYKIDYLDTKSEYFRYENYRWYAYFGLSGLMALILLFIAFGLILGICGYKKNNLPSNRSGVSNCGGNCLMASVGFMFFFSFFLMLFCMIWYAVGTHLYLGCRGLENGELIDDVMGSKLVINKKTISVENILKGCRGNEPLFKSIGGESVVNLTAKFNFKEYTKNIDEYLGDLKGKIDELLSQNLLTPDTEAALDKAINSGVNGIDFAQFISTLKESITQNDLGSVAGEAEGLGVTYPAIKTDMDQIAADLRNLNATTVKYISGNITLLETDVKITQTLATTLTNGSVQLLADLKSADTFFKNDTGTKINDLVVSFTDRIIGILSQSTEFIVNQALNNLLRCKPIADLYDGLINTLVCDDIVQNVNGFWLALGWCLLFFVFAIIFSVKLAKFFRKMDYDAGIDNFDNPPFNDKIPLQSIRNPQYGAAASRYDTTPPTEPNNFTDYDHLLRHDNLTTDVRSPGHGDPSNRLDDTTTLTEPNNLPFTDYNRLPQQDDFLDYDIQAPPPYQQHNNQGYHNQ